MSEDAGIPLLLWDHACLLFFLLRSCTCSGWSGGLGSNQMGTAATEAAGVAAAVEAGNTGSALHLALRNLANDSGMGYV